MRSVFLSVTAFAAAMGSATVLASDANRFVSLHDPTPYYVSHTYPKLVTPQWVGQPGVEGVVVFAIDDLNANYDTFETFLRPLLNRLKQIDGRSPVTIFTLQAEPNHPQVQKWLAEGLNLDVHTRTHPCPLLINGDFKGAKWTVETCIDDMHRIPNNRPVAFRMPCCDIWNTNSPRFYSEIFGKTTSAGNFLSMASSTLMTFTDDDPDLPAHIVKDEDGRPRFRKYFNQGHTIFGRADYQYGNAIYNYPYPILVAGVCWEVPMMVSDHTAAEYRELYGNHTLRDWKAGLDAMMLKRGILSICFHASYRLQPEDHAALADYMHTKYGSRVLFLNFAEVQERINKNMLAGQPIRAANGQDNGVRVLDINGDGYLDVVIGNEHLMQTRIWDDAASAWKTTTFPTRLVDVANDGTRTDAGVRFGVVEGDAIMLVANENVRGAWRWRDNRWQRDDALLRGLNVAGQQVYTVTNRRDRGVRLRDVDNDGSCELIVSNSQQQAVFRWSAAAGAWERAPYALPKETLIVDDEGRDAGLRFVDVTGDGYADVVFSNDDHYAAYAFVDRNRGWARQLISQRRDAFSVMSIPPIVSNGTYNGAWFAEKRMFVQNEHTGHLKDHAIIIPFEKFEEMARYAGRFRPLTQWQVLGPFANENEKGFETDYGPEKTPGTISREATYTAVDGRAIQWRPATMSRIGSAQGFSLPDYCREHNFRTNDLVVYLSTTIDVNEPQRIRLLLGSEDGIKVWLNGRLVHSKFVRRPARLGDDQIDLTLQPGQNVLLIKLEQVSAGGALVAGYLTDEAAATGDPTGKEVSTADPSCCTGAVAVTR